MTICARDPAEVVVGICPGLTGAIAAMSRGGDVIGVFDMPKLKRVENRFTLDLAGLASMLHEIAPARCLVERQHQRPDEGAVSSFLAGTCYGQILGILATLRLEHGDILPGSWRRLHGLPSGSDAAALRLLALRMWPETAGDLRLARHHGRVKAQLVAEVCRRRHFLADRVQPRRAPDASVA